MESPATAADTSNARPDEEALEAELRAAWGEYIARLNAAIEAEDLNAVLQEFGAPTPEREPTEQEVAEALRAARLGVAIMPQLEGARTRELLVEGDRAALIVERETCVDDECSLMLSIARFARQGGAWRASPGFAGAMWTAADGDRDAWIEQQLASPRFALDPPRRAAQPE